MNTTREACFKRYGAKRLLKLAGILDKADALHKKRGEPSYCQTSTLHECGAPACAMGHWAAATPSRFSLKGGVYYLPKITFGLYSMARQEFGVTLSEGIDLFGPDGCDRATTAKQAARYIRAFVKRKQKALAHSPSVVTCPVGGGK